MGAAVLLSDGFLSVAFAVTLGIGIAIGWVLGKADPRE